MLKPRMLIVSAILVVLPVTVFLGAQASLANPNGCRSKPGSSAPPGAHWSYRLNRPDNERCWFLSRKGMKARLHARNGTSLAASARPISRRRSDAKTARAQDAAAVPPAQVTPSEIAAQIAAAQWVSAEAAFTEIPVRERETSMDFAARWLDLRKSLDSDGPGPVTVINVHAEKQADGSQPLPLIPLAPDGLAAVPVDALFVLLPAGAVFVLARRRRANYRDHWRAAAADGRRPRRRQPADFAELAGRGSASGAGRDGSVRRASAPTDPAHDPKASLRELMDALQRAGAGSTPLRSFAPPAGCRVMVPEAR